MIIISFTKLKKSKYLYRALTLALRQNNDVRMNWKSLYMFTVESILRFEDNELNNEEINTSIQTTTNIWVSAKTVMEYYREFRDNEFFS